MGNWQVIQGDSLVEIPRLIERGLNRRRIAIITDNPYGMNNDANYARFTGGVKASNTFKKIVGDDKPFDPTYWLQFDYVTLWGYQYLAQRLPLGSVLVWSKKRDNKLGVILSDAELGWEKGGCGVYQFNHLWDGFDRDTERGERTLHPNQKPIALMRWCIERRQIPQGYTIVDPYCGSGATLLAAHMLGYDCIGIDVDAHNCEVTRARLSRASGIAVDIPRAVRPEKELPLFQAVAWNLPHAV